MSKVTLLTGGLTNNVVYTNGSVLKKYSTNSLIQGFGKSAIERCVNEYVFLKHFNKLTLAPKPLEVDLVNLETKIEYFAGQTVDSAFYSDNCLPSKVIMLLTESLNLLHEPIKVDTSIKLEQSLSKFKSYLDKCKSILEFAQLDSLQLESWVERLIKTKSEIFSQIPNSLIHGDFWLNNVLIDSKVEEIKIIDWEFGSVGSPYIDLGTYYIYSQDYSNFSQIFNDYKYELDIELILFFASFRIIKLLSFINLDIYKRADPQERFSFAYMTNLLKKLLNNQIFI